MSALLEIAGLSKRFGGLIAVREVSFAVEPGEIFGIIGPNGAGKTTLFNLIAGHYRPTAGTVAFDGQDITGHASDAIGRLGIARTFQAVHLFRQETVAKNLHRAAILAERHSPIAWFARRGRTVDLEATARFLGLADLLDHVAGSLAYGLQKRVGIGMAMMVSPKLLLMDEPAAGLNSSEKL